MRRADWPPLCRGLVTLSLLVTAPHLHAQTATPPSTRVLPQMLARPRVVVDRVDTRDLQARTPTLVVRVVNQGLVAAPAFVVRVVSPSQEWTVVAAAVNGLAAQANTDVSLRIGRPLSPGTHVYQVYLGSNDPDNAAGTLQTTGSFVILPSVDLALVDVTWELDPNRTLRWVDALVVNLGPDASRGGILRLEGNDYWGGRERKLTAMNPGQQPTAMRFDVNAPLLAGSRIRGGVSLSSDAAQSDPNPSNDRREFQLDVPELDYDVAAEIEAVTGTTTTPARVRGRISNLRRDDSPPVEAVLDVNGTERASRTLGRIPGQKGVAIELVTPDPLPAGRHSIVVSLRRAGAKGSRRWLDPVRTNDRAEAALAITVPHAPRTWVYLVGAGILVAGGLVGRNTLPRLRARTVPHAAATNVEVSEAESEGWEVELRCSPAPSVLETEAPKPDNGEAI